MCVCVCVCVCACTHRWLRSSGVSLSSERKQRKIAKQQVGDNLDTETAPFSFNLNGGGEELRAAPHVFIPNLAEKVLEQNEKYSKFLVIYKHILISRAGRLTWHNNIIPHDKIWIKVGDKGGRRII